MLLDPHVDDLDAILPGDPVQRSAHVLHDALPLGREERGEGHLAELVADFRAEDRAKLLLELRLGSGANVHQQRIDDAVAGESVDLEPALVGRQHLLALHVDVEHALVDPHDLLGERKAPRDARAGRADRLARANSG